MLNHLRRVQIARGYLIFLICIGSAAGGVLAKENRQHPLTPILPLDDIRVGMKGYGLTVFQGTRIEPFEVEVVSVMRSFAPGRAVVWIRCPSPRMQKLGPVQGMSGSPIYLWTQADSLDPQPGQGGKLIGALALGFSGTKDCYVGVQPIEQMRQAADRADDGQGQAASGRGGGFNSAVFGQVHAMVFHGGLAPQKTWRAKALLRVAGGWLGGQRHDPHQAQSPFVPKPPGVDGQVVPMGLPLMVGSASMAHALAPTLMPLGIVPVSPVGSAGATGGGAAPGDDSPVVGAAPPGVDLQKIRFEPGSVLSVPLVFGDLDMTALGTVTELQPGGRVLAFGHGIFAQGPIAVPMATGYVHFVMPSLNSSFKLGGSGVIRGAIVRDEHSAVIGDPAGRFTTAPVEVVVNMPTGISCQYHYQVVHHRRLTASMTAAVVLQSIIAQNNLPTENTLRLRGEIRFSGGRVLELDSTLVDASATDLTLELLPVVATMMQNPHESMAMESFRLTADIEPVLRSGSIVHAQIDRAEFAPGQMVHVTLQIQPHGKPPIKRHMAIKVPESLPDGAYELIVCDAPTYVQLLLDSRPHLLATTNADDLHQVVQRILRVTRDAMYAVLQLPDSGLAVGRQELPQLPSSRRALFDTTTSTAATPYAQWVEQVAPMGLVVEGGTQFTIGVRQSLRE